MAVHGDLAQNSHKQHTNTFRKHLVRKDSKPKLKPSSRPVHQPVSTATNATNKNASLPEVKDDDYVIAKVDSRLRTLHGLDIKDRIHRSMLLASDDLDLHYTLESEHVKDTFGVCKCLRGNVFPFDDSRLHFRSWIDDVISSTSHFLADCGRGTELFARVCPFCKRRKRGAVLCSETTTVQRTKPRKPACKISESKHDSFRYQSDIGMYIKEYRKCYTITLSTNCNSNVPVLGKDVPDPYLHRIRSFSDVLEKLDLLTTSKSPQSDVTQRKLRRTPSAPSMPDKLTTSGRATPERALNRLDSINLTPLPGRQKDFKSNKKELRFQVKRRGNRPINDKRNNENSGKALSEEKDDKVAASKKHVINNHIICNHVANNTVAKKPHPNTSTSRCKKFTSSTQYLDLTSSRVSFPLPVHIAVDASTSRDKQPTSRSLCLPRCRSATSQSTKQNSTTSASSGFGSSGGSSFSTTGSSYKSPIYRRLFRCNTMADVSGYGYKNKPLFYADPASFLSTLTGKRKPTDQNTDRLLAACLVKHDQQPQ